MITEVIISSLLVIGGLFGLIGSFGLLKLDDPMKRLHAPTKATTVGVGTALIASVLYFAVVHETLTWQELLIVVFLFATAPITANFLSKVHLHLNVRPSDLPDPGADRNWATYEVDPEPLDAHSVGKTEP